MEVATAACRRERDGGAVALVRTWFVNEVLGVVEVVQDGVRPLAAGLVEKAWKAERMC
jgi:hypothetical protein